MSTAAVFPDEPTNDPQASVDPIPTERTPAGSDSQPDQTQHAAHEVIVALGSTSPQAMEPPSPENSVPVVNPLLFIHVTTHHDLEQMRVASENRLRILTTTGPDEDGEVRGLGLPDSHPDVARLAAIVQALQAIEHGAELNLKRAFRTCAIYPWVKAQIGLGDKQVARLLGAIGDPYWHLAEDRPRTVSELWAYSGLHVLPVSQRPTDTHCAFADGANLPADRNHHDAHTGLVGGNQTSGLGQTPAVLGYQEIGAGVAARRRKGVKANWSTDAKMRAYLCAVSCIKKVDSPYRAVYLARREHTAVTHPDWTAGHSNNDGLRIASKEILKDLWRESRRLHGDGE